MTEYRGFPAQGLHLADAVLTNNTSRHVLAFGITWRDGQNNFRLGPALGSSALLDFFFGHAGFPERDSIPPGGHRRITPAAPPPSGGLCWIDFALLDDGTCLGPDDAGTFPALLQSLHDIQSLSVRLADEFNRGNNRGVLFETFRPSLQRGRVQKAQLLGLWGHMILNMLIDADDDALSAFLARYAKQPAIEPRRG